MATEPLEKHLKTIKQQGYFPWENPNASKENLKVIDAICPHGRSWWSAELIKKGDLYDWDHTDYDGDEDADHCEICINNETVICTKCTAPWPVPSNELLIKAWDEGQDLILTEKCKCGTPWATWCGLGPEPSIRPFRVDKDWSFKTLRHVSEVRQRRNDKCKCGSGKKYKHCCI